MEIHQLEYLAAVAEEGSISKAARRVGVAQPSLSQQVKRLEDDLGHRLLDRLPKGVVLTEAGRQLLEHARRVLAEIADARRRIGDTPGHVAGALAVGAIPTMAPFLLPGVLRRFAARWPDVKLTVVEDVTERLLESLERGELDVAVMSAADVPATVHVERVASEPLRLLLPANHRLARGGPANSPGNSSGNTRGGSSTRGSTRGGTRGQSGSRGQRGAPGKPGPRAARGGDRPVPWADVEGERLLVLQEMHCLAGQVSRFCQRHSRVRTPVFMRGVQLSTIASMVSAGLGVSVVPEMMCRAGPWTGCAVRPLAGDAPAERDICVAWSLLRYRTNAARAFEDLLRTSLAPHPPSGDGK